MKTRAESWPIILSLGLAGFVVMADNWVVSPIIPSIAKDISASPVRTAILITAYMLPFALFQLIYGPLADRYGKLRVLKLTLIGFTVACGATALGVGLTDLSILRALTGAFAAATMPVSLALIGDTVRMEDRQSAIGSFMGISFLGQGLSMAIGGSIAFLVSWRGVFLSYAVLSAIVTVLLVVRTKGMHATTNPKSEILAPYGRLVTKWSSLKIYLIVLVEGALIVGSFSYMGAFLSQQFGMPNLAIGAVMTAFGVMAVIAGRKSGALAEKIGRRQTLFIGLLLAMLGNAIVFFLGGSLVLVVVAVASSGAGFMLAHSTLLTIATEFAAKARGTAMSLVAFCFMGGGALGTALGGRVVEASSYLTFFGLAALLLFGLSVIALTALSQTGVFQPSLVAQPSPSESLVEVTVESEGA